MTHGRRRAALALLAATLLAEPAHAARLAAIVRGVGAGSDKAAALTGHYIRDTLGRDERYEVIDLNKALGNQDRDRALRAFQGAEEMVQKGRDAFDALELDAAVDFIGTALSKYERYAAYVGDFKKVAEALMLLGATHVLRGEEKLGVRRLEQALAVFPTVEPDPRVFNPAMRTLFQETVVRVNARAPGSLSMTSSPGYAEVYVDGQFAGVTPTTLERVAEGRHYVRLERDGYRSWGKVLEVTGRSETAESAVLAPTQRFDEFDNQAEAAVAKLTPPAKVPAGGAGALTPPVEKLGTMTSADLVLLVSVRLDGERVQVWANLYDLNGQRLLKGAEHSFNFEGRNDSYEREVAVMLHEGFGTAMPERLLIRDRRPPRAPGSADGRRGDVPEAEAGGLPLPGEGRCALGIPCRAFKGVALGVGLGVGGAAMATGGVFWFLAKRNHDTWQRTPQIDPQSPVLAASGRADALRGDILFGTGLAVAAVGTALFIWYEPAPTATEVLDAGAADSAAQLWGAPTAGGMMVGSRLVF